jgi:hypothetical protein
MPSGLNQEPYRVDYLRDLWMTYWRLADLAERQKQDIEAKKNWMPAFEVLSDIEKRGLDPSPEDRQYLDFLCMKTRGKEP